MADPPPATWSLSPTERGPEGRADGPTRGIEWLCEKCTRENIRGIEGRLDSEWW
ncbi:MAG: hypothetical protein ACJ735_02655 [Actinomycetes bacterium]